MDGCTVDVTAGTEGVEDDCAWDTVCCTVDVTAGTEGVENDCAWDTVCCTVDIDGCMVDGNACNG